jgi:hypothetical protein
MVAQAFRRFKRAPPPRSAIVQPVLPLLATFGDVFELCVTLRDIEPAIWRRVRVPADASLAVLHEVLQVAFGWTDSHLHDFLIGGIRFGMVDVDDEMLSVDECAAPVGAVSCTSSTFIYRYDFGDGWEHEIRAERMIEGGDETIVCTGGARACPPEDCGGPIGYARLLEVLAHPKDEEYAEMKRWVGRRFDQERFNVAAVNKKLATLSRRLGRRRK